MNIWVNIVIILIIIHLVLGFGWLVYKLSPKKKKEEEKQ